MAELAAALGRDAEAADYRARERAARAAFQRDALRSSARALPRRRRHRSRLAAREPVSAGLRPGAGRARAGVTRVARRTRHGLLGLRRAVSAGRPLRERRRRRRRSRSSPRPPTAVGGTWSKAAPRSPGRRGTRSTSPTRTGTTPGAPRRPTCLSAVRARRAAAVAGLAPRPDPANPGHADTRGGDGPDAARTDSACSWVGGAGLTLTLASPPGTDRAGRAAGARRVAGGVQQREAAPGTSHRLALARGQRRVRCGSPWKRAVSVSESGARHAHRREPTFVPDGVVLMSRRVPRRFFLPPRLLESRGRVDAARAGRVRRPGRDLATADGAAPAAARRQLPRHPLRLPRRRRLDGDRRDARRAR